MSLRFRNPESVAAVPDAMINSARWDAIFPPIGGYSPIVEDCTIPIPDVSTEKILLGSRYRNVPSFVDVSTFNVTFYCDVSMNIFNYIDKWKSLIRDNTTHVYGFPDDYCKKVSFYLYGYKNLVPVMRFDCINCFPTKTSSIELKSTEKPDRIKCVQTFSVDNVQMQQILAGALATNLLGGNLWSQVLDQGVMNLVGNFGSDTFGKDGLIGKVASIF